MIYKNIILLLLPTLLFSYKAKLSKMDHVNSRDKQLINAEAILAQDRANYHKFNKRDSQDSNDDYFTTLKNRQNMAKMIQNGGGLDNEVRTKIENSNPLVSVIIAGDTVQVLLADEKVQSSEIENSHKSISTTDTTVKYAKSVKVDTSDEKCEEIFTDAWKGKYKKVKELLDQGVSPNCVSPTIEKTVLMAASRYGNEYDKDGNLDVVKLLVNAGADIDIKDENGHTAVYYASRFMHHKTASYLIKLGGSKKESNSATERTNKELAGSTALAGLMVKGIGSLIESVKEASSTKTTQTSESSGFRGIRKFDCYKIKETGPQQVCLNGIGGDSCYSLKNVNLQQVCLNGAGGDSCYTLQDYALRKVCFQGVRTSACDSIQDYNKRKSCQNFSGSTEFWLIFASYGYYTWK